ncbi:MAG: Uncharacterized protein XD63_0291 [Thermoanaerobacterales bacterium 50_218]|nr:MAG: Uncharacterized protein XD63_0291 [Thermoanaerobacterales bacterium 50_218]HAA90630.1 iron-sulfur cluster-binding protein [Peptococcaceae bacterium]
MQKKAVVAVLKTSPETVLEDYERLLELAGLKQALDPKCPTILKLNLSWTKYFPACSTQPWQLEGVLRGLLKAGFTKERLYPVENKTVVTDPVKGARNNAWLPVLDRYGLEFIPLPEVKWVPFRPKKKLFMLDKIFPEGFCIPEMFIGKQVVHLPTLKTHGHSTTTGAVKNSFGGLLQEVRHYCHKYIHEVLADLMIIQQEIHPGIFGVMDGTVAGDGAGPRTMIPKVKNIILASADSVALDAVAAKLMGFQPLEIPYLRICHEHGLGIGDPSQIEVVGEDVSGINFGFKVKRSLVIWGDQMIRRGFLRPFEHLLLHTKLMFWAPLASNIYHDWLWYPTIGSIRIRRFLKTEWGRLFLEYLRKLPD